ncbi:MAG: acetate kinase [Campylobacterota bacterium]|nr:acetate kinase [Campylobacterota bacterium]
MIIAVINSGSSSIKFKLFDVDTKEVIIEILIEDIGNFIKNHHDGLEKIVLELKEKNIEFSSLDAIAHRVVHGGESFSKPVLIDENVIKKIKELIPLAPLHNPANLEGIIISKKIAPNVKQIAVFDTSFHSTMPIEAFLYAIPYEMYEKYKIRRYGFHGTSHSYILKQTANELKKDVSKLNLITLHLGNGASACAIKSGKSIDTSMGFTPLEGLVMGTRSGDLDPAILIHIQRELGSNVDELDKLLNKESGLKGICGENDLRKIIESNDDKSKLAISMMVRRIQKYIGAYMMLLGKVDAIVFTGGIGENSKYIREKILDSVLVNNIKVLVIKTDEELEIVNESLKILGE